jgi:hypothetical protein
MDARAALIAALDSIGVVAAGLLNIQVLAFNNWTFGAAATLNNQDYALVSRHENALRALLVEQGWNMGIYRPGKIVHTVEV